MADWTEKYRPSTLSEVRGNDKARDAFADWARSWDDHRGRRPPREPGRREDERGPRARERHGGWETVELNASDQRTADVIERFAGAGRAQRHPRRERGGRRRGRRRHGLPPARDSG